MENSHLRKGLLGIAFVFTATTLGNLAGYFIRLVLAHTITPTELGLFYSVYALIMFILLFVNLGTTSALTKYIAEFKAKDQKKELWFSIKIVTFFKFITSFIAFAVVFFSAGFLSENYFKIASAEPVIKIFAVTFIFMVIVGHLGAILQGFQDMFWLSWVLLSENLFFLIFTFVMIFIGFPKDHLLPSYAMMVGWIFTALLFLPLLLKYKKFFIRGKIEKNNIAQKIVSFSIASFMISLGNLVIGYIDTIILTYFRPLSEVGVYNVILPTVIVVGFLSRSISQVFFPMVSELWAKKMKQKLVDGINLLHKYAIVIVIPLAMLLFVFPGILINVMFGKEYLIGTFAMQVLSIGIIFFTIATIDQSILSGIGQPKAVTKIILTGAVFNFITNIIFVPIWGMNAAATTTTLSYILIQVLTSRKIKKHIKLKINIKTWINIFIVSSAFVLSTYMIKSILSMNVYLETIICLTISTIVYFILCIKFGMIHIDEIKRFIFVIINKIK